MEGNSATKNHLRSSFLLLVCQKDFLDELVELQMSGESRQRVLALLQSWAAAFSSEPAYSALLDQVAALNQRRRQVLKLGAAGVVFPPVSEQEIFLHTRAKVSSTMKSMDVL